MRSIGSHGSILAILTALTAASSAHAEYVNFTVTPPAGQSVTQIKIEPICATCSGSGVDVASSLVPAAEPPKPAAPRKARAAKNPSCDCDACEVDRADVKRLAVSLQNDLAAVVDEVAERNTEIERLRGELDAAKAKPADSAPPLSAVVKTQGRGSSRGRGGAASAAAARGPEDDFSPIRIRGTLTTP